MKTRIVALLLAVVCLFAFAACKETPPAETPDTAYSLYTVANEQLAKLRDGADMDIKTTVGMNLEGMENTTSMNMSYKICGNNMYAQMSGQTVTYVDGILYTLSEYDFGEGPEVEKIKAEISPEEMAEDDTFEGIPMTLPTLTEEALADAHSEMSQTYTRFHSAMAPAGNTTAAPTANSRLYDAEADI